MLYTKCSVQEFTASIIRPQWYRKMQMADIMYYFQPGFERVLIPVWLPYYATILKQHEY